MAVDCFGEPSVIVADGDIVGPGVLTAFFISATVTHLAVIYGDFWDALDDQLLNFSDRRYVGYANRQWRHLRRQHTNLSNAPVDHSHRDLRREALTRFIVTLSDQQLVTGLAMLIAGVAYPHRLTGYELSMVLALAWFSSMTHLTTLYVLRSYLAQKTVVRDFRVLGMLVTLVLLVYTIIISTPSAGSALPVSCVFVSGSDIALSGSLGRTASGEPVCASRTHFVRIHLSHSKDLFSWRLASASAKDASICAQTHTSTPGGSVLARSQG